MEPIAEISPEEAKQDKPVLRYPELSPEQQSVLNVLIQRLEQIGTAKYIYGLFHSRNYCFTTGIFCLGRTKPS